MVTWKIAGLFVGIVMLATAVCLAEEAAPKEMELRIYRVPPGFVPGKKAIGTDSGGPANAQSYLEEAGVTFPSGAFAQYLRPGSMLIIRNTAENLDMMDFLVGGCGPCFAPNPAVEFVALDCAIGPGANRVLTLGGLRQLAPDKVRRLSQVSLLGRSGFTSSVRLTGAKFGGTPSGEQDKAGNFLPGEFGASAAIEPVIGPDGVTVDLGYRFRLRRERAENRWTELDLLGDITLRGSGERILHVSPLETEGHLLVVIARVTLRNYDGSVIAPIVGEDSP